MVRRVNGDKLPHIRIWCNGFASLKYPKGRPQKNSTAELNDGDNPAFITATVEDRVLPLLPALVDGHLAVGDTGLGVQVHHSYLSGAGAADGAQGAA